MAKYYKLIDACTGAETFNLPYWEKGVKRYKFYTLYPGQKYSEHIEDELFVHALKEDCHRTFMHTKEREEALKKIGARYKVVKGCGSCSGNGLKLDVWLVEVV